MQKKAITLLQGDKRGDYRDGVRWDVGYLRPQKLRRIVKRERDRFVWKIRRYLLISCSSPGN